MNQGNYYLDDFHLVSQVLLHPGRVIHRSLHIGLIHNSASMKLLNNWDPPSTIKSVHSQCRGIQYLADDITLKVNDDHFHAGRRGGRLTRTALKRMVRVTPLKSAASDGILWIPVNHYPGGLTKPFLAVSCGLSKQCGVSPTMMPATSVEIVYYCLCDRIGDDGRCSFCK